MQNTIIKLEIDIFIDYGHLFSSLVMKLSIINETIIYNFLNKKLLKKVLLQTDDNIKKLIPLSLCLLSFA